MLLEMTSEILGEKILVTLLAAVYSSDKREVSSFGHSR